MKIMKELERGLTIHTRIGKVLKITVGGYKDASKCGPVFEAKNSVISKFRFVDSFLSCPRPNFADSKSRVGKPFKDRCRKLWWQWMIEQDTSAKASRGEQSKWMKQAWDEMPADIIRNAWRKNRLTFFDNEEN